MIELFLYVDVFFMIFYSKSCVCICDIDLRLVQHG